MSIDALSRLYASYQLYPVNCFTAGTPVQKFRELYPHDHYSRDVDPFPAHHKYSGTSKGADMPWWGRRYFGSERGRRVVLVSQDSLAPDAGSVVFWMHLFDNIATRIDLMSFSRRLDTPYQTFRYASYDRMRRQMTEWGLDLDFVFITDAAKVYRKGSWRDRDFDRQRSRRLLKDEVELCRPDLIVLLGAAGLSLLRPELRYEAAVENGKYISIGEVKSIVAPFPIGQGLTQLNFAARMATATNLIRAYV